MPDLSELEILALLVERLVDCPDPAARERLLVEALHERGWAEAVGLFHAPRGGEEDLAWEPRLARGPEDLLPDGEVCRAVFTGELPEELPLGRRVVFGWRPGGRTALAVGGFHGETNDLDRLEALLQAASLVDGCEAIGDDLIDALHAPLPGNVEPEPFGAGLEDPTTSRGLEALDAPASTDLAARLLDRCEPWTWALAQRGLELEVRIAPDLRGVQVPVSGRDLDALLDVALDENLARLRAAGARCVRIELDRSGERLRLGLTVEPADGLPPWSEPDPERLAACGASARRRTAAFELFFA